MATRKRAEKSKVPKEYPTNITKTVVDKLKHPDGTIEGEYSRSVYFNNELISFDIDWKKLEDYMKKVG